MPRYGVPLSLTAIGWRLATTFVVAAWWVAGKLVLQGGLALPLAKVEGEEGEDKEPNGGAGWEGGLVVTRPEYELYEEADDGEADEETLELKVRKGLQDATWRKTEDDFRYVSTTLLRFPRYAYLV